MDAAPTGTEPASSRAAPLLAGGSFALSLLLSAAASVYLVRGWAIPILPTEFGPRGFVIAFAIGFAGVGAVVAARRPSNPIGWIFCALGLTAGVMAFAVEYGRWAVLGEGTRPAGALYAAWVSEWLWIPMIAALAVVAAIFPDGRFLSAAWRRAIWLAVAGATATTVLSAITPRLTVLTGHDNPVGVGGEGFAHLAVASTLLLLPLMVIAAAAAIVRFRRSRGEERQQLKWLALSMTVIAATITFYGAVAATASDFENPQKLDWAEYLMTLGLLAMPVSVAFGVLKYRLYDIDIVINRAVVYAGLAVFITLVYVAVVVGVGTAVGAGGDAVLSALAAAVVALAFQPAHRRAQRLANRIVYGERATPYEVLSELSTRFAGTYSLEDALPRLVRVTAEAVGSERTRVWLRSGEELRAAAAWPREVVREVVTLQDERPVPRDPGERWFPVRHQGELLGAVSVRMPAREPLTAPQEKLLEDVAAHAGLVLRNVSLLEDLRASRKRIVAAQDDRARALERNIHDGAQQQLVALSVRMRLAQQLADRDPPKAGELLEQLQAETQTMLEDLRDLARGIYPPLLADKGLTEALEAQARKASLPILVEGDGVGRYPPEIESAIYFCTLEALQNVAKYANASSVEVHLGQRNGVLELSVHDDGAGFDPATTPRGAGLLNMADRLAAVDGALEITSRVGEGTTILGRVPVGAPG